VRILFVEFDPDRQMKRLMTERPESVSDLLNARFVADGRVRIRRARLRFGRVFAAIAVNVVEMFGLGVIWLEFIVADRPRGRNAAVMLQFAEILAAQSQQGRAVKFRQTADEIMLTRFEFVAFFVEPVFGVVVAAFEDDGLRA
jgi:hypothetical protein